METNRRPIGFFDHPVMRTTIIVSVGIHALIFLGFKNAFPSLMGTNQTRLYEVELIRPPMDDLKEVMDASGEQAAIKEDVPDKPAEPYEDTISLNTKNKKYINYATVLKSKIGEKWEYPPQAREYLLEGTLLLVFTLSGNGALTGIEVLNSSGHEILDKEACRAVQAASPFPVFPEHIRVKRLHIRASFDYRLTSR